MASADTLMIPVGTRTYVQNVDGFGAVLRPSFLGLKDAPVIEMDDGSLVAYAGAPVLSEIVPVATGKSLDDKTVSVPLDVKTVGTDTLNAMGIDAAVQAQMFQKFLKLPKTNRQGYADQWTAVSGGTADQKKQFVDAMVLALS